MRFIRPKNLALTCLILSIPLASAGFTAVAGSGDRCPDQGIKEIPSEIKYGPMQDCGGGLRLHTGPITLQTPANQCPTFAIYEPVRHLPTHKPGFYTKPNGKVPVTAFTFQCVESWLLGFIPIPISSSCLLRGTIQLDGIQTYLEVECVKPIVQPAQEVGAPRGPAGQASGTSSGSSSGTGGGV